MTNRRRQVVATMAIAALVCGLVTVATLTGTRERASAVQLLSGDAWLANRLAGTVTHVNGYTKRADPAVRVGSPGDPFTVVQRPDGAYMLDTRTGELTRVGDDGLGVRVSSQVPGSPSALRVISMGAVTWVIDTSSGIVQRLNPGSLAPTGIQIPLGGPVGSTVIDASGDLWAARPGGGVVDQVSSSDGSVHQVRVGQAGDLVQLVVTSAGTWAVDPQAGDVFSLTNPSAAPLRIPQTGQQVPQPVVASTPAVPDVAVVSGAALSDVNTATGVSSSVTGARYAAATQAVIANGRVYLLDGASQQIDIVGLGPLRPVGSVAVPAGSDQLLAHDNLVFVNDDGSPAAAVVDAAGQVTDISKYQVAPTMNGPSPRAAPGGNAAPAPNALPVPGP
ncbi:MAG: hypothetical protein M3137_00090, partial [Actinomycetota bacterium]|nr:hypothetical protein [Actinomycetota bacterium]